MSIFASFVDESLPTDNDEMYCSLCQKHLSKDKDFPSGYKIRTIITCFSR